MLVLYFPWRFILTASLRRRRMSTYISLVTIPVNNASELIYSDASANEDNSFRVHIR